MTSRKDFAGHPAPHPVVKVSQFRLGAQSFIASAAGNTVSVWDTRFEEQPHQFDVNRNSITALAIAQVAGYLVVVSADDSHRITIRRYHPGSGFSQEASITDQMDSVGALCVTGTEQPFRVTAAGGDGTIRSWQVAEAQFVRRHKNNPLFTGARVDYRLRMAPSTQYCAFEDQLGRTSMVRTLSAIYREGRPVFVSAGGGNEIYVWDLNSDYEYISVLKGHTDAINSACSFEWSNRIFLASASDDRTLRIWATDTWATEMVIPVQREALSVSFLDGVLYAGLSAGLIAIRLNFNDEGIIGLESSTRIVSSRRKATADQEDVSRRAPARRRWPLALPLRLSAFRKRSNS